MFKPEALEISVFTLFLDLMERDVYLLMELWCYWLLDVSNPDKYNRREPAGIQEFDGCLVLAGSKGKRAHVQLQSEPDGGSLIEDEAASLICWKTPSEKKNPKPEI